MSGLIGARFLRFRRHVAEGVNGPVRVRSRQFDVELLEDRILLSADPALALAADTEGDGGAGDPSVGDAQEHVFEDTQTSSEQEKAPPSETDSGSGSGGDPAKEANEANLEGLPGITISADEIHLSGEQLPPIPLQSDLVVDATRSLTGSGAIVGGIVNEGRVAPGNSPGIIQTDSYTQADDATVTFEIGGLTPGPGAEVTDNGYDQINVTGTATLAGTLDIDLINSFTPEVGQSFELMTWGAVNGKFDAGEGLFGFGDGGLYFDIKQTDSALILTVERAFDGEYAIATDDTEAQASIGRYLNADYFVLPQEPVTVEGDLSIGEFIHVTGGLTFDFSDETGLTIDTGLRGVATEGEYADIGSTLTDVSARAIKVGISDADLYFGMGIEPNGTGPGDAFVGLAASGVDLAFVSFQVEDVPGLDDPELYPKGLHALKGSIDQAGLVGIDLPTDGLSDAAIFDIGGVTATLDGVTLTVNGGSPWSKVFGSPAVDFAASYGDRGGFAVETADGPVSFDFDGEQVMRAQVAQAEVGIDGALYVQGEVTLDLRKNVLVDYKTGLPLNILQADIEPLSTIKDGLLAAYAALGTDPPDDLSVLPAIPSNILAIGGTGLQAFVGIGGPYRQDTDWSADSNNDGNPYNDWVENPDAFGFDIANFTFGFAQVKPTLSALPGLDKLSPVGRAAAGHAEAATLVGGGEVLAIDAADISLAYNDGKLWLKDTDRAVVDFSSSFTEDVNHDGTLSAEEDLDNDGQTDVLGLQIATGAGSDPVVLDFDGERRLELSIGNALIEINQFVYLQGAIDFSRGPTHYVDIITGLTPEMIAELPDTMVDGLREMGLTDDGTRINGVPVSGFTLGGTNLDGFVGFGGNPYHQDGDWGEDLDNDGNPYNDFVANAAAIGLVLEDVDFGMALLSPPELPKKLAKGERPTFVAMDAEADKASFLGNDRVTIEAYDVEINANLSKFGSHVLPFAIDFASSFPAETTDSNGNGQLAPAGLAVRTGGVTDRVLDFDQALIRVTSANAYLTVLEVLEVVTALEIDIDLSAGTSVTLADGTSRNLRFMEIGAADARGFIGVGGPYFEDTDADGRIEVGEDTNDAAVGIALQGLDLGLVLADGGGYIAGHAEVDQAALAGTGDTVTLSADDLVVDINFASNTEVIDFTAFEGGSYQVGTGNLAAPMTLDFDEAMVAAEGTAALGINLGGADVATLDAAVAFSFENSALQALVDGQLTVADTAIGLAVSGFVMMDNRGLATRLTARAGTDPFQDYGIAVDGDVAVEINTTGESVTYTPPADGASAITLAAGPDFADAGAGPYAMIAVDGSATLLEVLELEGRLGVILGTGTLDVHIDAALVALRDFGVEATVEGVASLHTGDDAGLVLTADVGFDVDSWGIDSVFSFTADAEFQLNTRSVDSGGISAETARIALNNAEAKFVGVLEAEGTARIEFDQTGLATIELRDMAVDLFGLGDISIDGRMDARGDLALSMGGEIVIGTEVFGVFGSTNLNIEVENQQLDVSGGISASARLFGFDFTGINANFDYSSGSGLLELAVTVSFEVFDETVEETAEFTIGQFKINPVTVANLSGGTLTVNVGNRADLRGFKEDVENEFVVIRHVSEDADGNPIDSIAGDEVVDVSINGRRQQFTGVGDIVVNLGDGYNSLDAAGVLSDISVSAGSKTDVLIGGLGDDTYTFTGSFGKDQVVDEGGDNVFDFSGTSAGFTGTIDTGLVLDGGNASINADATDNLVAVAELLLGSGSDALTVTRDVTGDLTLDGGSGSNAIVFQRGGTAHDLDIRPDRIVNGGQRIDLADFSGIHVEDNAGGITLAAESFGGGQWDMSGIDVGLTSTGAVDVAAAILARSLAVDSGAGVTIGGAVTVNDAVHVAAAGGAVTISGGVTSGSDVDISATGSVGIGGSVAAETLLVDADGGGIGIDGAVTISGQAGTGLTTDVVTLVADDAITLEGDITVSGAAAGDTLGGGKVTVESSSGQLDFANTDIRAAGADVVLGGTAIVLGGDGLLATTVHGLTMNITGSGAHTGLVIEETDDLVSRGLETGGDRVDLTLLTGGSFFSLDAGRIVAGTAGAAITLVADDIDFETAANTILATGALTLQSRSSGWSYRIGSAAENAAGDDENQALYTDSLELSTFDLAAIGPGFSSIAIGDDSAGTRMVVGDATADSALKAFVEIRGHDSRLAADTTLRSEQVSVRGDFVVNDADLAIETELLQISGTNLHNSSGGLDSGLTANNLDLDVGDQLSIGGWLRAGDLIDIDVTDSTGTHFVLGPGIDGPFSFVGSLGSVIETLNDGSLIDIDVSHVLDSAAVIRANGAGSSVALDAGVGLTIAEGGILAAQGDNGSVTARAASFVHTEAASAVIAGADFDNTSGSPVAVVSGADGSITLDSDGEAFIAGSVTASGAIAITGDGSHHPHLDYFQTLDADHPLADQSGFDVMVTGTITSLGANQDLTLMATGDLLVRGTIDLQGADSNLTLDSDRFVYVEGSIDVTGDITVDASGANGDGRSVYLHETTRLVTSGAGTDISITGAEDVLLFGDLVAGGSIGADGVTFAGSDSTVSVTAGERLDLHSAIFAAASATLTGGTPGADDGDLGLKIGTAGGVTVTGNASDGSGALITVTSAGDMEVLGRIVSGGARTLDGTIAWSGADGTIDIDATGRAFIGGNTVNSDGDATQAGGFLYAASLIDVTGGTPLDGTATDGLRIQGASELVVEAADGRIALASETDAVVNGLLLAGGTVTTQYDANGGLLGRDITRYDGDSTLSLTADGTISLGQRLAAGLTIDITGGGQGASADEPGLTLLGSAGLSTWRDGSSINLNAPGPVLINPLSNANEIAAQGWRDNEDGVLGQDVTLRVTLDKVSFQAVADVTVTAAATADNQAIQDLVADLQAALDAAQFTVTASTDQAVAVGDSYTTEDPENDPDFAVKILEGRVILGSPYEIGVLAEGSVAADALGFDLTDGDLTSSRRFSIDAAGDGAVANIGAPNGSNGKITIGGRVRADSAINLFSGTSPDGTDIDLLTSGLLETVNGDIAFNAGENGVIRGDLVAGGTGSDVRLSADTSLTLFGSITADHRIELSAGTDVAADTESIRTEGTSSLRTTGANGEIVITGVNDVTIDSLVGPSSADLRSVTISSTDGSTVIARESGRLEGGSGTTIRLQGADVTVDGVIRSTGTTADPDDYQLEIDVTGTVTIAGDVAVEGSALVHGDQAAILDGGLLRVTGAGETLRLSSDADVTIGGTDIALNHATLPDNQAFETGGLVEAVDTLQIAAADLVTVRSAARVLAGGDAAAIAITGTNINVIGSVLTGATQQDGNVVWTGTGADASLTAGDTIVIGGSGIDGDGNITALGGRVTATGTVALTANGGGSATGIAITSGSTVSADADGAGALTVATPGSITLDTDRNLQINGLLSTLDSGGAQTVRAGGQVLIGGRVQTAGDLLVQGGVNAAGPGLVVGTDGTLQAGVGQVITLRGSDDLLLQGTVGTIDGDGAALNARIVIEGGAHEVTVTGEINARDTITVTAADVSVLAGGKIEATAAGSTVALTGTDTLYTAGASGETAAAAVSAGALVHLHGETLTLDGSATARDADGRMLATGTNQVVMGGTITTPGSVDLVAGVGADWSTDTLRGTIARADLDGGLVWVSGDGQVDAEGDVTLLSGGTARVAAQAAEGDGTLAALRPVVTTQIISVETIVGFQEVEAGTIEIPVETWLTTEELVPVGTQEVKVGREWHEMDVTIVQTGYYNASTDTSREYFIAGYEYYNSETERDLRTGNTSVAYNSYDAENNGPASETTTLDGGLVDAPVIDWQAFLGEGSETPEDGTAFGGLTDAQKDAVLQTLGFRRIFDLQINTDTMVTKRTESGVATESNWTPEWLTAWQDSPETETGIFAFDLPGWSDRFIRMPKGAAQDILQVVSQGLPETNTVTVGSYQDTADITMRQIYSGYTSQSKTASGTEPYASYNHGEVENISFNYSTIDNDGESERWSVEYQGSGERRFVLNDGSDFLQDYLPVWANSDSFGKSTLSSSKTSGSSLPGDVRPILAQTGFVGNTEKLLGATRTETESDVYVGKDQYYRYLPREYFLYNGGELIHQVYVDGIGDNYSGSGYAGAYPSDEYRFSQIATPTTAEQNAKISSLFDGEIWLNISYRSSDRWEYGSARNLAFESLLFEPLTYTNWDDGEPDNDDIEDPKNHQYVEMDADGRWDNVGRDGKNSSSEDEGNAVVIEVVPKWDELVIREDFHHYESGWQSTVTDIEDLRLTADFRWRSNATDIFGEQTLYETQETRFKEIDTETQTVWETQPITDSTDIVVTQRTLDDTPRAFSAFEGDSIIAGGNLRIEATSDIEVAANIKVDGATSTVTFDAGRDILQDGVRADGVADDSLAAQATVRSSGDVTYTAGRHIDIGRDSVIAGTEDGAAVGGTVSLTAADDLTVGGSVEADGPVSVTAGAHLTLNAAITSGGAITAGAGTTGGVGAVTGSLAALESTGADTDVTVSAGSDSGDITLTASVLTTAGGDAVLTAAGGTISQEGTSSIGGTLRATAETGVTLGVGDGTTVAASVTGSGDAAIVGIGAVTLDGVTTADGSVTATVTGSLDARSVTSAADLTLTALDGDGAGPQTGNLSYAALAAAGTVRLDAGGAVSAATGATLDGASLEIATTGAVTLATAITDVAVTTRGSGDVDITALGSGTLTLRDTYVKAGSLTVGSAAGSLVLDDVRLGANTASADLTATAAGDILVGFASAGVHSSDASETRALTSFGDVSLTAGGVIAEITPEDTGVDLVADALTLSAGSGISGLEVSANTLASVEVTGIGAIALTDIDGYGENQAGLRVADVRTAAGAISLTADGVMTVLGVTVGGAGNTASLTTTGTADLAIETDADDGPAQAGRTVAADGVILDAGGLLILNEIATGPEMVSYTAGQRIVLPDGVADLSLSADRIVLDTGDSLDVGGTLEAAESLTLASDRDVVINGSLIGSGGGALNALEITARGSTTGSQGMTDPDSGLRVYSNGTTDLLFRPASDTWVTKSVDDQGDPVFTDVTADVSTNGDGDPVYAGAVVQPKTETVETGSVNINVAVLDVADLDIRASGAVGIDVATDFAFSGSVAGVTAGTAPDSLDLRVDGTLDLSRGLFHTAESISLKALNIVSSDAAALVTDTLTVETQDSVALNTNVTTAVISAVNAITLQEAGDIVLEELSVQDGAITVEAGGTITAEQVTTDTDGAGNSISLTAGDDLLVDYVEAGLDGGIEKTAATVHLDAQIGQVKEVSGADNDAGDDVLGFAVAIESGTTRPTDPTDDATLEILSVSALADTVSLDTPAGLSDVTVEGDYILMAANVSGDISVTATGVITVLGLEAGDRAITLNAGSDIIFTGAVNAGTGSIEATAAGQLSATGLFTADSVDLTSGGALAIQTDAVTVTAEVTGSGALSVADQGSAAMTARTADGAITLSAVDTLTVTDVVSETDRDANDIALSADTITITALDAGSLGDVTVSAVSAISADALAADHLVVRAGGPVDLTTTVTSADLETTGAGALALTDSDGLALERAVSADGPITVRAAGALTVSTARSSTSSAENTVTLESTGADLSVTAADAGAAGTVVLAAATSVEADAVTANRLEVTAGTGADLTTDVAELAVTSTGSGDVTVSESDALTLTDASVADGDLAVTAGGTIAAPSIVLGGTGNGHAVTLTATAGAIDVTTLNAGADGQVTLSSATGVTVSDATADLVTVSATSGSIDVTVDGSARLRDVPVEAGRDVSLVATGDVTLPSLLNIGDGTATLKAGGLLSVSGTLVAGHADLATGADTDVTVGVDTLTIHATGGAAFAVTDIDSVTTRTVTNAGGAEQITVSARRGVILGDGTDGSGVTLTGSGGLRVNAVELTVTEAVSAETGTVHVNVDALAVNASVATGDSGQVVVTPRQTAASIGLGDGAAGSLQLDQTELAFLQQGSGTLVIGQDGGAHTISLGIAGGTVTLAGDTVLRAQGEGGHVDQPAALETTDGGSFTVHGSGATYDLGADIDVAGDLTINDRLRVSGERFITAGGTVSLSNPDAVAVEGSGDANDSLSITTAGTVSIDGTVGRTSSGIGSDAAVLAALTVFDGSLAAEDGIAVTDTVTLTDITAARFKGDVATGTGGIAVTAGAGAGTIQLDGRLTGGAVTLTDSASATIAKNFDLNQADLVLDITGDLSLTGTVSVTSGSVTGTVVGALDLQNGLSVTTGGVDLAAGTALTSGAIAVGQGAVDLTGGSDVTLTGQLQVLDGTVSLTAAAGALDLQNGVVGAAGTISLHAGTTLDVTGGIDLTTAALATTSGGATSIDRLDGGTGAVTLEAGGTLAVDSLATRFDGDLSLTSGGRLTLAATETGDRLRVTSDIVAADAGGGAADLTLGTADLVLSAEDALDVQAGLRMTGGSAALSSSTGPILVNTAQLGSATLTMRAANDVQVGQAVAGSIAITAETGALSGRGSHATVLQATALSLTAATGIGQAGDALAVDGDRLTATSTAGGGLFLEDVDSVTVDHGGLAVRGGDGALSLVAAGPLTILSDIVVAGDGALHLSSTGSAANSDIHLAARASTAGGSLSLNAGNRLTLAAGAILSAGGNGNADVTAGTGGVGMAASSRIETHGGALALSSGGTVALGVLDTTAGGTVQGDVFVRSVGGSIVETVAGGTGANIRADQLRLEAGGAIGTAGNTASALDVAVTLLSARSGSGTFVSGVNGLTIGGVDPVSVSRVAADGSTAIETFTPVSNSLVNVGGGRIEATAAAGNLTLAADHAVRTGGDILMRAVGGSVIIHGTVESTSGAVALRAANDIQLTADARTEAAGSLLARAVGGAVVTDETAILRAAGGDLAVISGASIDLGSRALSGTLDAGSNTLLLSSEQGDIRGGTLNGQGRQVAAGAIALKAAGDIGSNGAVVLPTGAVAAEAGSGGVTLASQGSVTLVNATVNVLEATVTAAEMRMVSLQGIAAPGQAIGLTAAGGIVGQTGSPDIQANSLQLTAGGTVQLTVAVETLALRAAGGSVTDTGALVLGTVTGGSGPLSVVTAGSLRVDGMVSWSGTLRLESLTASITVKGGITVAGALDLISVTGVFGTDRVSAGGRVLIIPEPAVVSPDAGGQSDGAGATNAVDTGGTGTDGGSGTDTGSNGDGSGPNQGTETGSGGSDDGFGLDGTLSGFDQTFDDMNGLLEETQAGPETGTNGTQGTGDGGAGGAGEGTGDPNTGEAGSEPGPGQDDPGDQSGADPSRETGGATQNGTGGDGTGGTGDADGVSLETLIGFDADALRGDPGLVADGLGDKAAQIVTALQRLAADVGGSLADVTIEAAYEAYLAETAANGQEALSLDAFSDVLRRILSLVLARVGETAQTG